MALAIPLIHMNGDSRAELVRVHLQAFEAVQAAIEKLMQCAPNMRNFYPQENGREAFRMAQSQHIARVDSLNLVQSELGEILEKIADADH